MTVINLDHVAEINLNTLNTLNTLKYYMFRFFIKTGICGRHIGFLQDNIGVLIVTLCSSIISRKRHCSIFVSSVWF